MLQPIDTLIKIEVKEIITFLNKLGIHNISFSQIQNQKQKLNNTKESINFLKL